MHRDARSVADLTGMLTLGRSFRALGRTNMSELLRVLPISAQDLADDWLTFEPLKAAVAAAGVRDIRQGPRSGGTSFVLLHYLLSRRTDGAIWRARATPPPESLARGLELFRLRGRVAFDDEEMFEEAWWACACIGLGIRPAHFAILAEQMSEAELLAQLSKIARVMRSAVEQLPPHPLYLQRYLA